MKANIFNKQTDLPISLRIFKRIAQEVVAFEKHAFDEVTLHFVDIKTISALHDQYFFDPSPTDCISFPMDEADQIGYKVLGEVFICPRVAIDYAEAHCIDPQTETILYVVHGLLHLMGYDDLETNDEKKMRRAEKKHLKHLHELNFF